MVASIADKETQAIWEARRSAKLPADIQVRARNKMLLLDAAQAIGDLSAVPGNRLEALRGGRSGQYSIRINDQWRVCFKFQPERRDSDGSEILPAQALDVEIVDYH